MGRATLLAVASIGSIDFAGRIAERRERRFKSWAWIAVIVGPLALPLIFLFPNLHGENGDHAEEAPRSDRVGPQGVEQANGAVRKKRSTEAALFVPTSNAGGLSMSWIARRG